MMSSNSPIAPPPRFQLYLAKKSLNKGIVYKGKEGVVVGKSEYIGSIAQDLVIGLVRAPLNEVPGRATLTTSTKPELVRQETSLPPPLFLLEPYSLLPHHRCLEKTRLSSLCAKTRPAAYTIS